MDKQQINHDDDDDDIIIVIIIIIIVVIISRKAISSPQSSKEHMSEPCTNHIDWTYYFVLFCFFFFCFFHEKAHLSTNDTAFKRIEYKYLV